MSTLNESFEILDYMWDIRNYFHANPELGLEEYKTADRIEKELNSLGIQTQRVGKTGILGTIDTGRPGKTLFMRADIDALPIQEENNVPYKSQINGKMHACAVLWPKVITKCPSYQRNLNFASSRDFWSIML